MSRIAKYPIPVPKGVEVNIAGGNISVKGPLGTIGRPADPNVEVKKEGEQIVFKALGNSNHANAMSGTMRALVAGMVTGVTKGFEKRLALVGVGFRAAGAGRQALARRSASRTRWCTRCRRASRSRRRRRPRS